MPAAQHIVKVDGQEVDTRQVKKSKDLINPIKKRFNPRIRRAIRYMVNDALSQTAAAEKAGIARETLCKALQKDHYSSYREALIRDTIADTAAAAAGALNQLVTSGRSEKIRMEASIDALDRAGYAAEKDTGPVVQFGLVIDLGGD